MDTARGAIFAANEVFLSSNVVVEHVRSHLVTLTKYLVLVPLL
jgi:hypothetical protein